MTVKKWKYGREIVFSVIFHGHQWASRVSYTSCPTPTVEAIKGCLALTMSRRQRLP